MRHNKNHLYAILVGAASLVSVYFLSSSLFPATLAFRERAFPRGFRELVLESASSPVDPLFGVQQISGASTASKRSEEETCDALFRDPDAPAIGHQDSPVQLVAFLDYRCPYCKKLTNIISKINPDYVRIIYKEWPILGDSSILAAQAALAAHKQGKYLAFHTRLMNSRLMPTIAYLEEISAELRLDRTQFREDMNSDATSLAIERTSALASTLGLRGTPALVVGHTIAQGEISRNQLDRLIENESHLQPPNSCYR